jgi:putative peptidoglycan lipid II flippase
MSKRESFLGSVGASVFWQGLYRIAGLSKHIIIAGAIGLSAQLDVFYLAMAILGVLVFSWGALLDVLAVPKAVAYNSAGEKRKFDSLGAGLITLSFFSGLVLCAVIAVGLDAVVRIPAGLDIGRRELLRGSFLWLMPVVLLYLPMRSIGALFRAIRRFSLFYQAQAINAIATLALVALFYDRPMVLFWSASVAIALAFGYLAVRSRGSFPLIGRPLTPEVKRTLTMAPKLLLLHAAVYVYQLADNVFISFLQEGSVGALGYGWTLMMVLPSLLGFGGAFITVFAEKRAGGEDGADVLNNLISMALLLGVPVTLFLMIHGDGIIALLLERGLFSSESTALTARALLGYSIGMVALLLIPVCDQVFQVLDRLHLQTRRVVAGLVLNVVLNWLFLFRFGWGVWGISLATSASYSLMLLLSLQGIQSLGIKTLRWTHLRWLLIVLAAGVVAAGIADLVDPDGGSKWLVLLQGAVFVAVFVGLTVLVPVPEVALVWRTVRRLNPRRRS